MLCILDRWEVTEEGRGMVERGSHEAVVWGLIGEAGIPQPELFNAAGFDFVPFKLHIIHLFLSRPCWQGWFQQGNVSWLDHTGQDCQTSIGEKKSGFHRGQCAGNDISIFNFVQSSQFSKS